MLHIKNLSAAIESTEIIKNLSLSINPGQLVALMGANGSGKSTLAHVIMGNPAYAVTSGTISYNNTEIHALAPDKRAQLGIFLAFQHPIELPGVAVHVMLKEAYQARFKTTISVQDFTKKMHAACDILQLDYAYLYRGVNEGFSGGEKKRLELLQLLLLEPSLILLDEIDSGLDTAGIQLVQTVITHLRSHNPQLICVVITHNPILMNSLQPDQTYVMEAGTIKNKQSENNVDG